MRVTLTRQFFIAPEGHTTIVLQAGEVVEGWIAEKAIATGCADAPKPKAKPRPKRKMDDRPLENKDAPDTDRIDF